MGCNGHTSQPPAATQPDLDFLKVPAPDVFVPVITVRQPDGSLLFKAGKPIIAEPEITAAKAASILGMSIRWVETECELGRFKTAYKPGKTPRSRWKIAASEVRARKESSPE